MADVVLIFPYFNDGRSKNFKFPPLGIGYIASYLLQKGYDTKIVDCTFLDWETAIRSVKAASPRVVGVYSMLSMVEPALRFARELRDDCELLVAGGPMPSAYPEKFLGPFDIVVRGEAEETMADLLDAVESGRGLEGVKGFYISDGAVKRWVRSTSLLLVGNPAYFTGHRQLVKELDDLPLPSRRLFDNESYKDYYRKNFKYTITSMIASRGCPFCCDFCWRPDYGRFYRVRNPENIVDEMEEIRHRHDYERIWFADELFIANKKHVIQICNEILERKLDVLWECLARADILNDEVAKAMKKAGCHKIIFGLESGDDRTLKLMNKKISVDQSRKAVSVSKKQGIQVGAFFILGYPGETNETMLNTIRMASNLPLDYFSMTVPYPLPGTPLYEKVKDKMFTEEWEKPLHGYDHKLIFKHEFSIEKLQYGMKKAITQSNLRKKLGPLYYLLKPLEYYTDQKFKKMG